MINPDTPNQRVLPSAKSSEVELRAGDIMSAQTPGSGGYGDPFKRRVDAVLNDVLDGKVSVQNAAELYGVVIDLEKKAVDETATVALRN